MPDCYLCGADFDNEDDLAIHLLDCEAQAGEDLEAEMMEDTYGV